MKIAAKHMDDERFDNLLTYCGMATAGIMAALSRMVYVEKKIPGPKESVIALTSSAGAAIFIAPVVAQYVSSRMGIVCDMKMLCFTAWVVSVMSVNIVVMLSSLDIQKWISKFTGKGE